MPADFFTTIKDPREIRKDILMSSKEIIEVLRDNQILMNIREEKKQKVAELMGEFEDLTSLLDALDKYFPDESLKKLETMLPQPKKVQHKKSTGRKRKKAKEVPHEETEMDKLERMLGQIEDKLKGV